MLDQALINETIKFHGHKCPGLAIGIRAADYIVNNFFDPRKEKGLITVTETNMCGVDALQFILSTTFGKGNLLFIDNGKKAFSFFNPNNGKSVRLVFKETFSNDILKEFTEYRNQLSKSDYAKDEKYQRLLDASFKSIVESKIEDVFDIKEVEIECPKGARIFTSIECDNCHEYVMETRIRSYSGENLCIPCFEKRDEIQKK